MSDFSYKDRMMNKNLEEFFGVEEADTYVDEENEEEYLGDYDIGRYNDEE